MSNNSHTKKFFPEVMLQNKVTLFDGTLILSIKTKGKIEQFLGCLTKWLNRNKYVVKIFSLWQYHWKCKFTCKKIVMWIRIGFNAEPDPNPGSTSAFIRIQIQGVKKCMKGCMKGKTENWKLEDLFVVFTLFALL